MRFGLLGDGTALLSPTLRHLREAFPGARIDVLATPLQRPLLEGLPEVDRVLTWSAGDLTEPRQALRLAAWGAARAALRELRRERYCLALSCYGRLASAVALLSGASRRVGYRDEAFPSLPHRHAAREALRPPGLARGGLRGGPGGLRRRASGQSRWSRWGHPVWPPDAPARLTRRGGRTCAHSCRPSSMGPARGSWWCCTPGPLTGGPNSGPCPTGSTSSSACAGRGIRWCSAGARTSATWPGPSRPGPGRPRAGAERPRPARPRPARPQRTHAAPCPAGPAGAGGCPGLGGQRAAAPGGGGGLPGAGHPRPDRPGAERALPRPAGGGVAPGPPLLPLLQPTEGGRLPPGAHPLSAPDLAGKRFPRPAVRSWRGEDAPGPGTRLPLRLRGGGADAGGGPSGVAGGAGAHPALRQGGPPPFLRGDGRAPHLGRPPPGALALAAGLRHAAAPGLRGPAGARRGHPALLRQLRRQGGARATGRAPPLLLLYAPPLPLGPGQRDRPRAPSGARPQGQRRAGALSAPVGPRQPRGG